MDLVKGKILICCRDAAENEQIRVVLSGLGGNQIQVFAEAESAYDTALRTVFDLLIIRQENPYLSGLTFVQKLRKSQNYGLETIILVCDDVSEKMIPVMQEYDIEYVITAPQSHERFQRKLKYVFEEEQNQPPFKQEYLQAKLTLRNEMADVAQEMAQQIYHRYGAQEKICMLLGEIAEAQNKIREAQEFYEEALVWSPQLPEALYKLARLHMAQHDFIKAATELNRLTLANPLHLDLLRNAGLSSLEAGDTETAKANLRSLSALDRADREAAQTVARIEIAEDISAGRCPSLSSCPSSVELAHFLDAASSRIEHHKDVAGGLRMYLAAVELMQKSPRLYSLLYNVGLAYVALKNPLMAQQFFRESLAISPEFIKAQRALTRLEGQLSSDQDHSVKHEQP